MNESTVLAIRNMVCGRCIRVVKEELENLGHTIKEIDLGRVVLLEEPTNAEREIIQKVLTDNGFELIESQQAQLIESVKTLIIKHIHHKEEKSAWLNFSDFLAKKTHINYFHLSKLFSSLEGITIEKYVILQRIERVKELLIYEEYNLSEISYQLGYSSVAHLSAQFKKVTGLTPTAFRKQVSPRRKALDEVNEKKKDKSNG